MPMRPDDRRQLAAMLNAQLPEGWGAEAYGRGPSDLAVAIGRHAEGGLACELAVLKTRAICKITNLWRKPEDGPYTGLGWRQRLVSDILVTVALLDGAALMAADHEAQ